MTQVQGESQSPKLKVDGWSELIQLYQLNKSNWCQHRFRSIGLVPAGVEIEKEQQTMHEWTLTSSLLAERGVSLAPPLNTAWARGAWCSREIGTSDSIGHNSGGSRQHGGPFSFDKLDGAGVLHIRRLKVVGLTYPPSSSLLPPQNCFAKSHPPRRRELESTEHGMIEI
ncbi:hypothetical protein CROQUDRAFT_97950 [Cronartium quercuum f. sp. fusiforme G11]|uniref:Uncharacterized protein n=1 Tax=Cronartium quercuum f. sp. fusiforme G11 TaxID=708437 RepID=A0A9P6ND70_9BASI|nr:hypothetical protein CROQUDRAFT_97950 [Cronartium quercuum f. sp. fusiforme G11]